MRPSLLTRLRPIVALATAYLAVQAPNLAMAPIEVLVRSPGKAPGGPSQ